MTAAEYFIRKGEERGLERGLIKGEERGLERGLVQGHCEVALNALTKGYSIEAVVDLTGLDAEVVEQLERDLKG